MLNPGRNTRGSAQCHSRIESERVQRHYGKYFFSGENNADSATAYWRFWRASIYCLFSAWYSCTCGPVVTARETGLGQIIARQRRESSNGIFHLHNYVPYRTLTNPKIGDGVNDSPAQAEADVGILLSLSRACMTGASDVVIMSSSLEVLPKIFDIARMSTKQAKWNVRWAIGYNCIAVSLAFGLFERWGLTIDA